MIVYYCGLLALLAAAVVADRRAGRSRDWAHWLGVIIAVITLGVGAAIVNVGVAEQQRRWCVKEAARHANLLAVPRVLSSRRVGRWMCIFTIRPSRRSFWPRPTWSIGIMPTCGRWPGFWPAARAIAVEVARRCFEWVRDEIRHSVDFGDTHGHLRGLGSARASHRILLRQEPSAGGAAAGERHPGRVLLPAALDRRRGPAILFARSQRGAAAGTRLVSH